MSRFFKLLSLALFILILPKLLGLISPFLIGFVIYLLCRRSVCRLSGIGLGRAAASFFCLVFAAAVVAAICGIFFAAIYSQAEHIPLLYQRVALLQSDSPILQKFLSALKTEFSALIKELSVRLLSGVGNVTEILTVSIFAFLSAFFFLKDEEKLLGATASVLGKGFTKNIQQLKEPLWDALGGYIRAQLLLMCVTFCILSVFLFIFGVKYFLPISLGIAFIDAIPVFGTGSVLLPWALWQFLFGRRSLAFALVAMYGVCSLTRQILEPKILSDQIGLHPLLTLAGVFVGFRLFGLLGLIFGPVIVLIVVTYIQKYH